MSKVLHVVFVVAAFSVCACSRDAAANSEAAGDDVQLSAVDTVGQPLSSVPTPRRRLAAGTSITATIQQIVSSRTTGRGQLVTAIVTRNVSDDSGHVLIPGGATIKLAIAAVRSARSATPD